jgi:hypothetical protein
MWFAVSHTASAEQDDMSQFVCQGRDQRLGIGQLRHVHTNVVEPVYVRVVPRSSPRPARSSRGAGCMDFRFLPLFLPILRALFLQGWLGMRDGVSTTTTCNHRIEDTTTPRE